MFDQRVRVIIDPMLNRLAAPMAVRGWQADHITWVGFGVGLLALPLLWFDMTLLALVCVLLNRLADGLDGVLARLSHATDAGGFLDICLDFIFYQAVVLAFALAYPQYMLPAVILMFSFVCTGVTFLAFAVMAERHQLHSVAYPNKSIHYLGGLAEGTETIVFFIVILIWPASFPVLALLFAALCLLTGATRLFYGYCTLRKMESNG